MEYIYAALLLHKLGKPINETGITNVIQASGINVEESKVKNLVASLKDVDIDKELESALVMGTTSTQPIVEKKEEPKEEKKEAAAEGLSALFG